MLRTAEDESTPLVRPLGDDHALVPPDAPTPLSTPLYVSGLAKRFHVSKRTIKRRLAKGWSPPADRPRAKAVVPMDMAVAHPGRTRVHARAYSRACPAGDHRGRAVAGNMFCGHEYFRSDRDLCRCHRSGHRHGRGTRTWQAVCRGVAWTRPWTPLWRPEGRADRSGLHPDGTQQRRDVRVFVPCSSGSRGHQRGHGGRQGGGRRGAY